MEIEVGINNIKESNKFLRKLWALFNKEFGKCAWQYSPIKMGKENKIFFGFVDLGDYNLEVSILYKSKGSITKIIFESNHSKLDRNLEGRLKKIVKEAKRENEKKEKFYFISNIITNHTLSDYKTQSSSLKIFGKTDYSSIIIFSLLAYDDNQAQGNAIEFINEILDFLSIETNLVFYVDNISAIKEKGSKIMEVEEKHQEEYQEDYEFIEGSSVKKNKVVISKEAINFLEYAQKNNNEEVKSFMRACHHFHSARKLESYTFDDNRKHNFKLDSNLEIANTLYLSALEVVSSIDFQAERCKECNQLKFSISKRVRGLANKYINNYVAKDIGKYYNSRSKYLHEGLLIRDTSPTMQTIPLLDNSTNSGCKEAFPAFVYNLREYTSYILRCFYREFFQKYIT